MEEAGKPNLVDYFLALVKIDPQGIRGRMRVHFAKIIQLFGRLIDERSELRKLGKTSEGKDVLDVLLDISEQNNEEIDRTQIEHLFLVRIFSPSSLIFYIINMCIEALDMMSNLYTNSVTGSLCSGGTDTTSNTVEWAMAELLQNPETFKKAKAELEQTIGKGKLVEESDISRLPYLQAIVKETSRIHPPVPILNPSQVPQGAQVLVNAWAIGRDPSIWPYPTSFMPERFLGSEIDVRSRDFELIPFGAGRRICPGLPLAIRMVPMMLGSFINSFDWKLEGGIAPRDLDMEEKFGITLQKAQPLRAVPINV
ncbi:hypothetical protein ACSBR2_024919 [Camellia fascicularis]